MQIVIDIPKDVYEEIMAHNRERREGGKSAYYFEGLIQNGTPLPEGHGDLIDEKEACFLIAEGKNGKAYFGTTNKDWEVIDFLKTIPITIEADKAERKDE